MGNFEDEYYLLYPSDHKNYPLIYEDCRKLTCSYEKYEDCQKVPDCPAYFRIKEKIENPQPFIMDFYTAFTEKKAIYADCYMAQSLSGSSFVVSPKLYAILHGLNIEGIQFIPVILMEDNKIKYADFMYVHTYNFLSVLSVKNSRFQVFHRALSSNNLLEIKFNAKKLGKILLENRLIFRFPLLRSYFIFHVSVVEKIMSANPIGFQFIKISDINMPNTNGIFIL
jgi:hypothetical protein